MLNNVAPYNFAGVARYKPGCLLDAPSRHFNATNTGGIPVAPFSFAGNVIAFNANDVIEIEFRNANGFSNTASYNVPASGFDAVQFNTFVVFAFANTMTFLNSSAVWGTAGLVKLQPIDIGVYAGQTAPVLRLTNRTLNTTSVQTLSSGPEKRIYPGRIVLRDYATDDNAFSDYPGKSAYGVRQFLHTVKRPETAVVDSNVLAYAGISGIPSMMQSYNRNGVNGTGLFDSLPVYHRALILTEAAPNSTFSANDSSYTGLFMETTAGYEGTVTNVSSASTVQLDPSQFSLVVTRGYGSAVGIQVNTI